MPPRLQLLRRAVVTLPGQHCYQPLAPFLYPCLQQHQQQHQRRAASILNAISDTKGAYNRRIRRGRGPASGKGKTAGRGHKGQGQHGKVPTGFNGGQTPEWIVAGNRGFKNTFTAEMNTLNLDTLQLWINKGRIDPSQPITVRELFRSRCVNGALDGVKLLARGKEELTTAVNIVVSRASADAIEAVEKLGGTVTTRYYTNFAIKKIVAGEMDPIHSLQSRITMSPASSAGAEEALDAVNIDRLRYRYRLPDPTSRKDIEYYRDSAKRGYLSHLVGEGQGPSLFFKAPSLEPKKFLTKLKTKQQQKAENRLW